jgi:hypothetical protein
MIITDKLYKIRYAVAGKVQPQLIIHAGSADEADAETLLYASEQEGYDGEEVRILAMTEVDVGQNLTELGLNLP